MGSGGTAGYRLVHQMHLPESDVVAIVFDSRNEADPFSGVVYWSRAVRQATSMKPDSVRPLKAFLVAARIDRGPLRVGKQRIDCAVSDYGFSAFFETSAKTGAGVKELREALLNSIAWASIPSATSTRLYFQVEALLRSYALGGAVLMLADDLYRSFLSSDQGRSLYDQAGQAHDEFQVCLESLERQGIIRFFHFGGLVLLRPELLDAYASSIIMAALEEPDGLGHIREESVISGALRLEDAWRMVDKDGEKLLLIATIEEMLRHEIVLREPSDMGTLLVFPSQLRQERKAQSDGDPDGDRANVIFLFDGSVQSVYATLVVRLSHSGIYKRVNMWRNGAQFQSILGGTATMVAEEVEEGQGCIKLYFDAASGLESRAGIEEYVFQHLRRRASPDTIKRLRLTTCPTCQTPVTSEQIRRRLERNIRSIRCNVCESLLMIDGPEGALSIAREQVVPEIDWAANQRRQAETTASILRGKEESKEFDVFLAHNGRDKVAVERLAFELRRRGLNPWLDEEQIPPGRWFQDVIQSVISKVKSAAVLLGAAGPGRWELVEIRAFVARCVEDGIPVIPVLLPGLEKLPDEFLFLRELNWVQFRQSLDEDEAIARLEWGITGRRRGSLTTT